ncbi:MAG: L-rhamnose/proton symporter RhaT [bacterium]
MLLPIAMCAVSGILLGSWTIFMRKSQPHQFENFFVVFVTILSACFIAYCVTTTGLGAFTQELLSASAAAWLWVALGGVGWGIGQILFGYGITMLGLALGYAIMIGVSMLMGTFVTMFLMGGIPESAPGAVYIYATIGVIISLVGIVLSAWAGKIKSSKLNINNFPAGLIVCISSGSVGSLFALSYAGATRKAPGFLTTWPAMAVIVFIYCLVQVTFFIYKIQRLKTWGLFSTDRRKYFLFPLISALMFSLALVFNFKATDIVGISLSYPMMMGIQIFVGNVWSFLLFKEWEHAPKRAVRTQYAGLLLLLVSSVLIGRAMGYIR